MTNDLQLIAKNRQLRNLKTSLRLRKLCKLVNSENTKTSISKENFKRKVYNQKAKSKGFHIKRMDSNCLILDLLQTLSHV